MILRHMVDIDETLMLRQGQGQKVKDQGHICSKVKMYFCYNLSSIIYDSFQDFFLSLNHVQNINVIWILGPDLMIWTHLLPKRKLERKRSRILFVSA